jgi:hypothetical protein
VCIATASVARQGFDRAEARLASFEEDVHLILGEFGRDLQSVLAEMKARPGHQGRLEEAPPWSLDDVTRLHSQLRESTDGTQPAGSVVPPPEPPAARGPLELPAATTLGVGEPLGEQPLPRKWRLAVVGLGMAVITTVGFGWYLQNQVSVAAGRAQQAELASQRAAADAAREAAAAREEAAREIASAREMANRADRIGNVLAAPDLIRYNLSGGTGAPGASGQALWSRTRGFVFSGSRLPPPPPNGSHHVWLLTRVAPIEASTFIPEPDGTVTLVEQGLNVPRAVVGVMVTAEAGAGGESPSGQPILTSIVSVQ